MFANDNICVETLESLHLYFVYLRFANDNICVETIEALGDLICEAMFVNDNICVETYFSKKLSRKDSGLLMTIFVLKQFEGLVPFEF